MNANKMKYSDQELEAFDQLLDEKIKKAEEQLSYYNNLIEEINASSDNKLKGLDDGATTSELENVARMASRIRKHLEHLKNAKIRVQNKTYGVCRVTGKLISKERLKAVPHATLSIEAKNMQ